MTPKSNLLGIGTIVPPTSISQKKTAEVAYALSANHSKPEIYENIFLKTEVEQRNSVVFERDGANQVKQTFYPVADNKEDRGPSTRLRLERFEKEAGPLAIEAARQALEEACISPEAITHLITVTCTGFYAPGFDCIVVDKLKLNPGVERVQVGFMGCHAIINGLRTAKALAAESLKNKVLVISVEIASLHYSYQMRVDHIISNALFSDGAAACIIAQETPPANKAAWTLNSTGSHLFPNTQNLMSWKIGDYGFEMTLSANIPRVIEENLRPWLTNWLKEQNLEISDIATWALHPGGPKILTAVEKALGLEKDISQVSRNILSNFGNMSSATLLFILREHINQKAPLPCLALGFGPGLAAEAALFK